MEQVILTTAGPADADRLQQISRQTFSETYASANTPENMRRYLEAHFSAERLAAELRDPHSRFYFALLGDQVIGYIKLNDGPAQTEQQDEPSVEIERIYVLQAFQGRQVGRMLYAQALQVARTAGAAYLWLGVWEHNPKAIRFYTKNGFTAFGRHPFRLGGDLQTDILMKRPVNKTP